MGGIVFFQQAWFFLIGMLLVVYSLLDGFDLGIGILFPFLARNIEEKRMLMNRIAPFWDGNEVWLVAAGGALFAAFPNAYATVFSGFYLALMMVLFSLIFRAAATEFWHHDGNRRFFWTWAFAVGSFIPSLLFGVALGNVLAGIPLTAEGEFAGNFFTLLRPYPLSVGLTGLTAILVHGSVFCALKAGDAVSRRARRIAVFGWYSFFPLFVFSGVLAYRNLPETFSRPPAWIAAGGVTAAWILLGMALKKNKPIRAFVFSAVQFVGLWAVAGSVLYPNLVRATNDPALSLTVFNSSSSLLTLKIMLAIAVPGLLLAAGYSIYAYRVLRGEEGSDDRRANRNRT